MDSVKDKMESTLPPSPNFQIFNAKKHIKDAKIAKKAQEKITEFIFFWQPTKKNQKSFRVI